MNKDNFKILIDAILFDGQVRFNMSCFVGKLNINAGTYEQEIKEEGNCVSSYGVNSLTQISTTDLFNCDSVGCIAGFATALANDWKTPEWLQTEFQKNNPDKVTYNMVQDFEKAANNFLALTQGQGRKLYFSDEDSVWKYLRYYENDRYPGLKYAGEDDGETEDIVDQYVDWDDSCFDIDYSTIDYKTAADVLTRIMNEEIVLGEDHGEIEINELALTGEQNGSV